MLNWLKQTLGRARRQRPDLRFLVYSRRGCHLCDDAYEQLAEAQRQYRFQLETLDVDSHPDLAAKYGTCVPVVLVNDKVRFRGRVNAVLLQKLLEGPGIGDQGLDDDTFDKAD